MTTYRKLTIEDVITVVKNANLNPHVIAIALYDPTLAQVTLDAVSHNGQPVADEASSVRRRLEKAGADVCLFSVPNRRVEFRIREATS